MILVSFSAKYVCEGKHAVWNGLECDSRVSSAGVCDLPLYEGFVSGTC